MQNLGSKSHLLGLLWDGMRLSHIHNGEARSTGQGVPSVTSYLEADSGTSGQIPGCQAKQGAKSKGKMCNLESPWELGVGAIKGLEFAPNQHSFEISDSVYF